MFFQWISSENLSDSLKNQTDTILDFNDLLTT